MTRLLPALLVASIACASAPRQTDAPPEAASELIAGSFVYLADAGVFTRCDDGTRLPVAMEGDYLALEHAYVVAPHEPGAPVIVTVAGHVAERTAMEGAPREHFIVDRFDALWPEETCEKATVRTPLANTYWRLVELDGTPVRPHEGQRETHVIIRADGKSMHGFAGCNTMQAGVTVAGDSLHAGNIVRTLATCPYQADEDALLSLLGGALHYRIFGETLLLANAGGRRAVFRATYF
ncbi:MAG TPA: META domain-containing protein [Candidatus Krumholzibacteria bacterium]|nr:META domain-containing protein [Candidatus Krumholzibacteria bacterium]